MRNDIMLTVSLVVYNSEAGQVKRAVDCILRATPARVTIIFNGPSDTLYEQLVGMSRHPVEVVRVPNRGYGAGHNVAVRKALEQGSDYHLVANVDLWWDGDVVTPMIEYLDRHPDTSLIAPRTLNPDGSLQYTCRMLPSPLPLFFRRFAPRLFKSRDDRYLLKDLDHTRAIDSPYLLGCFMLFRCDALREYGIFDERFFMYPEDIDITRRLHRHGKTLYWPEVTIVHEHARESGHNLKMLKIHTINMIKYFNKYGWIFDRERREFNRRLRSQVQTGTDAEQREIR